jgi:hypothetical protein
MTMKGIIFKYQTTFARFPSLSEPPFCKPWSLLPFTVWLLVALYWSFLLLAVQILKSENMLKNGI